ncbi:recombinase family protein [Streptomyces sp. B1866]|uniref:recombinase family protein n=1 Tax=Streptomyces sp. B1866 TaxID=3075431 RepID=UPI0028902E10|nr:recombinase family protein [Streptomyces sp. B1866]MDT3395383.1 recombinase family protein [Streptomyces sp. B1866]
MKRSTTGRASGAVSGDAAVYCRISQAGDDDQTGVDRQERICREVAERLALRVADVFVDNNRSAWKRNRKRPGWDELLARMGEGAYGHVIVYHPDRLMRQPKDLEELLTVADDRHVVLHGQANRKDLSDPDDRFILRIEVAHACRSSDDTSRRVRTALEERARAGKPHGGHRRYGYTRDQTIVEAEAEIIREVYRRFLNGESARAIAKDLHDHQITTCGGKTWHPNLVRRLLSQPYVAGIQTHNGQRVAMGTWTPIIDLGQWEEVQQMRGYRTAHSGKSTPAHYYYLLRGVVTCTCGRRMSGNSGSTTPYYRCNRAVLHGEEKCTRVISAPALERFARDVALEVLEKLDITGRQPAVTSRPQGDEQADQDDAAQLAELNGMWLAKEIPTAEYRAMRRAIEDRIRQRQRRVVQRPVAVLKGVAGPDARASWAALEKAQDYERMNAVFRFLFAAVIIHPVTRQRSRGLDFDRIEVVPNPLD